MSTITHQPIANSVMRRVERHVVAVETADAILCSCGRGFSQKKQIDHVHAFRLHGGEYA